jgi:hypothetical protein
MKTVVTFDLRIRRPTTIRFHLRIWTLVVLALVLIGAPLLELVGQLSMDKPAVGPPPPLSDATQVTGTLHFTRGARDWKEGELHLHDGKVLPLRCRRFLASDACFNLKQGDLYEGARATVWWHPSADVLQLSVDDKTVVTYADTVARFETPVDNRLPQFLIGYLVLVLLLLLVASQFMNISLSSESTQSSGHPP